MGNFQETRHGHRHKSMEALRSLKVGIQLKIIAELVEMNLSVSEVETVLRTCRLNPECAARFGASIRDEKTIIAFSTGLRRPDTSVARLPAFGQLLFVSHVIAAALSGEGI